ncbi:MAG: tRNA (guanosine(37)-N1)-methyltransferase TrmD [Coriobacteriia bacterium]|nr:tRNA (guanosine(37)-N1)-methyltransferase TrmD [Coriobacteriia bacterium]MBN2822765.1 tRNA (guanosine(37)-N1)-methyltransferase TrmD [Coriobacteriia bacterium]
MRIDIISIFPELFEPTLSGSMLGIAQQKGAVTFHVHNLRDWAEGRHRTTDDYSFGGGPGMVMKPEPFFRAHEAITAQDSRPVTTVLMCPQGELLRQPLVEELATHERLVVLAGRYEGYDDRIRSLVDREISIGDYVLTGGELPAMVLIDSVTRLLPGVLGHDQSATEESFSWGLLEYPQYTRPASFEGMDVPEVLLSGDHGKIAAWRRQEAIRRTAARRPDILAHADLTAEERLFAEKTMKADARLDER